MMDAQSTIERYFAAFNAGDIDGMLDCLDDSVAHHVNEGDIRIGKDAFAEFCGHMAHCYAETLTDMVIFTTAGGVRGAAEYTVNGTYRNTDAGLPAASGQTYKLPAGSFFSLKNNRITRVVTYYNLADWIRQVS